MSVASLSRHLTTLPFPGRLVTLDVDAKLKRLMDIVLAMIAMLLLLPLFLIVAVAIKLTSRGPLLFRQVRVGENGKPFDIWKFRSMYIDAEARKQELASNNDIQGNLLFKMKRDPRITPVGRVIRKLSIDELPQLWNVLQGSMSMVGPRPAIPAEVNQYTPYQAGRLGAKPGITCIWQVSGRSDIPFEQQVELDLEYIRTQSIWLDLKLLLLTVPAVLTARGAY